MGPHFHFLLASSPQMPTKTPEIPNTSGSMKEESLNGKKQPYLPIIIKIISRNLCNLIIFKQLNVNIVISVIIHPQR